MLFRSAVLPLCLACCGPVPGAETAALFYMTDRPESIRSFVENAARIDIVGPQVYSADEKGLVWGGPDPRMMEAARRHKVAVMPLVVNPGFRQETIHKLLASREACGRMIGFLLGECRRHGYAGIQFDFENINAADRDAYTGLCRQTAAALRKEGYQFSAALVSRPGEFPGKGDFARWMYEHWRGVFDIAELAKFSDFLSLMTYDQHTRYTPPGPVAGYPWVEEALSFALAQAPAAKISLGIPTYGRRWHAGMRDRDPGVALASVSTREALELAAAMNVQPQWDAVERAPWFTFYRDGTREYVFYNDARSFEERYRLARSKALHGVSVWVLGQEDPGLWKSLPVRGQ